MDTFVEQIVLKKKDAKQITVMVCAAILAAALMGVVIFFAPLLYIFVPILLFGIGYGLWWVLTSQNVEYEYCITNGDVDIDQIVARSRRKRIVSVNGKKIESAGKYDPAAWQNRQIDRFVMAAPSEQADGLRYFTYRSKKRGFTLVVFQPDERVAEAFYKFLPRLVQMDWDK